MVQVVTNENIQQLIQTRQVPEFKAPEAKTEPAKTSEPAVATDTTAKEQPNAEPQRGPDGKFVKTEEKSEPAKADDTAAKAAESDDDDPALTEKIRKLIAKKHRAMKEAEEFGRDEARRALAAEARADALEREIQALKSTKSGEGPATAKGDDEPKPEDFKTVGEYAKALTKWEVAQAKKADGAEKAKQTQQQNIVAATERLAERVAEFAKATPDYAEVMKEADWEVPPHVQAYFVDSENPGQLGYYLAKNPDEYDRIAKLSPIRAFAELGKLEDKLTAKAAPAQAAAPATTQVSRAPAPITPLEGKSTTVAKDPSQMTFAELRAHRQAERAAGKR